MDQEFLKTAAVVLTALLAFLWFLVKQAMEIGEKRANEKQYVTTVNGLAVDLKTMGADFKILSAAVATTNTKIDNHIVSDDQRFGNVQKEMSDSNNLLRKIDARQRRQSGATETDTPH